MTEHDGRPPGPPSGRGLPLALGALALILVWLGCFLAPLVEAIDPVTGSRTNPVLWSGLYLAALALVIAMLLARPSAPSVEPEGLPVCAHCMRPYRVGVHFCPRDSTPLTVFAATAGYEAVHARAWAFGKAIRYPTRWLHVLGITVFTAPVVIGMPAALLLSATLQGGYDWADWFAWSVVVWCVYAWALYCTWHNWLRYREDPAAAPAESEYGAPPWWTYDRWWTLPEDESDDLDEFAGDDGDEGLPPSPPPPSID